MSMLRLLRSLPLKRQTVVKSLLLATLLFIMYQLTFVAELSNSTKPKPLSERLPKHDKVVAKERAHSKETAVSDKNTLKRQVGSSSVDKKQVERTDTFNKQPNSKEEGSFQGKNKPKINKDTPEVFVCRVSGRVISKDKVNDDFCDCPEDGSDETSTNACNNSKFTCVKSVKFSPKFIPSAWVNDGVCDCCDGSDEWQRKTANIFLPIELQKKIGHFISPCPNQCS